MKNSYTQQQKYKQAGFKMRRGVKQTLFQRRHRGSQQAHKRMFNITDYWAIANKNHNGGGEPAMGYYFIPLRMVIFKKTRNKRCW